MRVVVMKFSYYVKRSIKVSSILWTGLRGYERTDVVHAHASWLCHPVHWNFSRRLWFWELSTTVASSLVNVYVSRLPYSSCSRALFFRCLKPVALRSHFGHLHIINCFFRSYFLCVSIDLGPVTLFSLNLLRQTSGVALLSWYCIYFFQIRSFSCCGL